MSQLPVNAYNTRNSLYQRKLLLVVVVWRIKIVMITKVLLESTVWLMDSRCSFVILELVNTVVSDSRHVPALKIRVKLFVARS
jgi:hypothetical protein